MTRVHVADDDVDILNLLSMKLRAAGYDVTASRDGDEALREIWGAPHDLAVIDVNMPRRSGLDVWRALRAEPMTASLPVVLISAAPGTDDAVGADALRDQTHWLAKPFSPKALLERITALVEVAATI